MNAAPYRDAFAAALDSFRERRAYALERASSIGSWVGLLPADHRRELAALPRQLAQDPASAEDLPAFEAALARYSTLVEYALVVIPELREQHQKAVPRRRRWALGVASVAVLAIVVSVGVVHHRLDCRATEGCRLRGLCTATSTKDGVERCSAESNGDCESSAFCRTEGFCVANPVDHVCVPTDESCERSQVCALEARCEAKRMAAETRECVASSDKRCHALPACSAEGLCSARDGRCRAAFPEDCLQSRACVERGLCSVHEQRCVSAPAAKLEASSIPAGPQTAPAGHVDLERIAFMGDEGRPQDNEAFRFAWEMDKLLRAGPAGIAFLTATITDTTVVRRYGGDQWTNPRLGDLALSILLGLFRDRRGGATIPGLSWDELLERNGNDVSDRDVLERFVTHHGREGIRARVAAILGRYEGQILWDEKEACYRPVPGARGRP